MNRVEFERVSPEATGVSSEGVLQFLDALDSGYSEMHGITVMRHGKIILEGWWAPYGPGMNHMCNSLTKTYMGTAIGIAIQEGLLKLNDRIIDIFPEYAPEEPSEFLKKLTLYTVLHMGTGMERFPSEEGNWVKNFVNEEIQHEPGTVFKYSSVAATFLGKIILKVTGKHVYDYLNEKLFGKIGINYNTFDYSTAPEGEDMWAWRAASTAEDNLRLMKVYLDGGLVNGERVLPEEFVKLATTSRIDNAFPELIARGDEEEACSGYGFQMWMCDFPGAYRADGAAGQYAVCIPSADMIVSINEHARRAQFTLKNIWKYLIPAIKSDQAIEENEAVLARLRRRLKTQAIPAPEYRPYAAAKSTASGTYRVESGSFHPYCIGMAEHGERGPVEYVTFSFSEMEGTFVWQGKNRMTSEIEFALDGTRRYNRQYSPWEFAKYLYANGYWESDTKFVLELLWPENDSTRTLYFTFGEDFLTVNETTFSPNTGKTVLETVMKKVK